MHTGAGPAGRSTGAVGAARTEAAEAGRTGDWRQCLSERHIAGCCP